MKKTKYQQIAEILENNGYISDTQTVKIYGDESGIYKVFEHIRKWKRLQKDRNFFADKKIIDKTKGRRCHLVRVGSLEENQYYKVGKEFWNEIVIHNPHFDLTFKM